MIVFLLGALPCSLAPQDSSGSSGIFSDLIHFSRSPGSQSGEWYSEAKTWVLGVLVAIGMLLLPGPFHGWSYGREQLSYTMVGNMYVFLHIMSIYTCVHSSIYLSIHPSICEFNLKLPILLTSTISSSALPFHSCNSLF